MVKLVGAVCILGAGTWAWRRSAAERRRELDTLADLTALLDRMGEEIRLRRTSLPRLLGSLGRDRTGPVRDFCTSVAASLARGAPLGQSWRSAAEALPLGPESRTALTALGDSLQGDEESVCKALALAGKILEKKPGGGPGPQAGDGEAVRGAVAFQRGAAGDFTDLRIDAWKWS